MHFLSTKKIVKNNEELYIKNDTTNQNYNFWTNVYPRWEQETFRIFDTYLQKDKVFIDIGGWIGTTCIYGSKKSKHVYVIEADPVAFADLSYNCTLNSNNITPIHRAIYNKSDTTVSFGKNKFIKNAKLNDSMSQIYTDTGNNDCIIVKTITISKLIDEYNINPNEISLIKVDIEGGEENILDSLFKLHTDYNIPLYISFHYTWWTNRDLNRFSFLKEHHKAEIIKLPFTSILFNSV